MKKDFFCFAEKKLLPGILIAFLAVLTIGTSAIGIGKVAGSFSSVKGVSVNEQPVDSVITDSSSVQDGSSDATDSKSSAGSLENSSPMKTAGITPAPTAASSVSSGGGSCIAALFGKQYNITNLLTVHSGGNVFACGTDMSASYQNQHGTNMSRMQEKATELDFHWLNKFAICTALKFMFMPKLKKALQCPCFCHLKS